MSDKALKGRRILLGVTGGIAAYKSAELCRMLIRAGAAVRVVMTRSATEFVTPLTFETLSNHAVYTDVFDRRNAWEVEHIAHARWADTFLVAPATANSIAKLSLGLADDALSTTALAFRGPMVIAPAMNTAMWSQKATRTHLKTLEKRGATVVQPGTGDLACGEQGAGRLADLESILAAAQAIRPAGDMKGKTVLITAGPTVESIDPVRHLSNAASGRMGYALAREAARRGAAVILISGPTHIPSPPFLENFVSVRSAGEMHDAVMRALPECDYAVFTAAVADYTPESPAKEKIKKQDDESSLTLKLVRTPDIAAAAGKTRKPGQVLVGFAAETTDAENNAVAKMRKKNCDDILVINEISAANPAFGAKENRVLLIARSGERRALDTADKEALAAPIWDFIIQHGHSEE